MKLSVALAVYNEEKNLEECLASIKDIAQEIVIVDGSSTDGTVAVAKKFGARIRVTDNPPMFHINKQKAIDMAKNEWILLLDADERVSPMLAKEIVKVISMSDEEMTEYEQKLHKRKLFLRHQNLLEKRDGNIGTREGAYAAFFIPRLNLFLSRYLRYGGVYPDGVIRLIRKGKAYLPCKDIHEQLTVEGRVGWLEHDLYHSDSPTFDRYIKRNNRYVAIMANELKESKKNKHLTAPAQFLLIKPLWWFILTYIRHKGFLDGWPGFVFSFFSALRFPRAYINSLTIKSEKQATGK